MNSIIVKSCKNWTGRCVLRGFDINGGGCLSEIICL